MTTASWTMRRRACMAVVVVCIACPAVVLSLQISQGDRKTECTFTGAGVNADAEDPASAGTATTACKLAEFGTTDSVHDLDVVFFDDNQYGCTMQAGLATGKALVVRRGKCPFTDKASAAAKAGASLLLVVNTDNTLPILGGRPDRDIPLPVVLVTRDLGNLVAAAKEVGPVRVSTVVADAPAQRVVRARERSLLLQPRKCSGDERLAVVHVRRSGRPPSVLINSAVVRGISATVLTVPMEEGVEAMAAAARAFISNHTIDSDIVVVILDSKTPTVAHTLAAGADVLAGRFCAIHGAALFAGTDSCPSCTPEDLAAFRRSPHASPFAARWFPLSTAFAAYADAAVSLLSDLELGEGKLLEVLREHLDETRVDSLGHLFYDLGGSTLVDSLGLGAVEVSVDASSGEPAAPTAPTLFLEAPGRVSTIAAGTAPAVFLNAQPAVSSSQLDRWLATMVRGARITHKNVASDAGDPRVLAAVLRIEGSSPDRDLDANLDDGSEERIREPRFIPVGSAGTGRWCARCFSQFATFTREAEALEAASDSSTATKAGDASSYPFASPTALRSWATWIVDGSNMSHTPAQVQAGAAGDTIFVANHHLSEFFRDYSTGMKQPYVLITDSPQQYPDHPGAQAVPGVWNEVVMADANLLAWWAMGAAGKKPTKVMTH